MAQQQKESQQQQQQQAQDAQDSQQERDAWLKQQQALLDALTGKND